MLFFILYFSIKNEHDLEPIWHVHVPLTLCNEFITLEFILFDIIHVLLQDCKLMYMCICCKSIMELVNTCACKSTYKHNSDSLFSAMYDE